MSDTQSGLGFWSTDCWDLHSRTEPLQRHMQTIISASTISIRRRSESGGSSRPAPQPSDCFFQNVMALICGTVIGLILFSQHPGGNERLRVSVLPQGAAFSSHHGSFGSSVLRDRLNRTSVQSHQLMIQVNMKAHSQRRFLTA